jgi:exo-beta-1,3-glucanase (GH17 family)
VVTVNVGNEALVEWNDHMVPLGRVIAYVREVKAAIDQPVTVADNYDWWIRHGAPLAAELDFDGVRAALPGSKIAIPEAGWATTASEFGERASEENQQRYYREVLDWATTTSTTVFFFVDRTPKAVMRQSGH